MREPAILLAVGAALLPASGIAPYDRFTWVLEVAPILIAVPILVATYRRFRLTLYELVEWWTALATGDAPTAFLGTQGDPWDTQEDMFCALVGAIAALLTLSRVHGRELARLTA